jgi:DNA-binding GntR family transcriptional regulator
MDVPPLDHDSHVPLYLQAADWVAAQVAAGKLVPGTRLPAERDLAEQWGVAYMTIRRMMAELRERGIVVSQPGKGTFIIEPSAT